MLQSYNDKTHDLTSCHYCEQELGVKGVKMGLYQFSYIQNTDYLAVHPSRSAPTQNILKLLFFNVRIIVL